MGQDNGMDCGEDCVIHDLEIRNRQLLDFNTELLQEIETLTDKLRDKDNDEEHY